MSWLRIGDTFWADPRILRAASLSGADARTVNELSGFLVRLGSYAAQYELDYLIPIDAALTIPHVADAERLIRMLIELGLAKEISDGEASKIGVIDDPDLLHMISKEQRIWRNQRVEDSRNPDLMVPIRQRDGDQCRWCGKSVHWPGKPSNGKATLDHLIPGERATVDTAVIACWSCNSARKNDPEWDATHKLLREPEVPLYGKNTVSYLAKYGVVVAQNIGADRQLNMSCVQVQGHGTSGSLPVSTTQSGRSSCTASSGECAPGSDVSGNDHIEPDETHAPDLGSPKSMGDTEALGVSETLKTDSKLLTLTNHDLSGRVESESGRIGVESGRLSESSQGDSGVLLHGKRKRRRKKWRGRDDRQCEG